MCYYFDHILELDGLNCMYECNMGVKYSGNNLETWRPCTCFPYQKHAKEKKAVD